MLRRYDSLKKMSATLVAALAIALVLEAAGLATWAQRLEVGPWRDRAIQISGSWQSFTQVLRLDAPRRAGLELRQALASVMIPDTVVAEAVTDTKAEVKSEIKIEIKTESHSSASYDHAPVNSSEIIKNPGVEQSLASAMVSLNNGSTRNIALVGDSIMAVGLAPALRRSILKNEDIKIIRAYRSGTGLGRPDVFNWIEQYPQMLGSQKPDLVICAIGANDAQSFQVGRKVIAFGTSAWDELYVQRLRAFLDLLAQDQIKVLWIGMPVMRDPGFSNKMTLINTLVRRVLADYPQVSWIDPNPYLTDSSGSFAQFRQNQKGRIIRMRADDGIHLSDEGAAYIVPAISQWLASNMSSSN
jgi:hypothetical protein